MFQLLNLFFAARGKKGKKIFPFIAMAAYMASMWYAITLKGIAAIAAKALVIGKIALILSAIIGLKKLTHGGDHHWFR